MQNVKTKVHHLSKSSEECHDFQKGWNCPLVELSERKEISRAQVKCFTVKMLTTRVSITNSETVIPNCSFDRHSDDPNTIDTAGAKWFHKGDLLLRSFHLLAENELKAYPRVL